MSIGSLALGEYQFGDGIAPLPKSEFYLLDGIGSIVYNANDRVARQMVFRGKLGELIEPQR